MSRTKTPQKTPNSKTQPSNAKRTASIKSQKKKQVKSDQQKGSGQKKANTQKKRSVPKKPNAQKNSNAIKQVKQQKPKPQKKPRKAPKAKTQTSDAKRRAKTTSQKKKQVKISQQKLDLNDGYFLFLVDGTVFKLSRHLVLQSCPESDAVLGLEQEPNNTISTSASRTISWQEQGGVIVLDENVENFRAFCWALHARVVSTLYSIDIIDQSDPKKVDFPRLISTLIVAHKLKATRFKDWSLGLIKKFSITRKESENNLLKDASPTDLRKLLVALMPCQCICDNTNFQKVVWKSWVQRLGDDPSLSCQGAIDCAEELGLRDFQGRVYYMALLRSMNSTHQVHGAQESEDLNPLHLSRLQRGFWSISRYWNQLRKLPECPEIPEHRISDHDVTCAAKWDRMWLREAQGRKIFSGTTPTWDPLGSLRVLASDPDTDSETSLSGGVEICGCHFRQHAQNLLNSLIISLPDHFFGQLEVASSALSR